MFAQGGEPSRVLVAQPCWWEDEEATCRQGQGSTMGLAPIYSAAESNCVNTNRLQQHGGAASDPTEPDREHRDARGV